MTITTVQYLRLMHLLELGVDLEKVSESMYLTMEQTIQFITEWNQYNKILELKNIDVELHIK